MTDKSNAVQFCYNDFRIDVLTECLSDGGETKPLRHQLFQVLLYMLENPCRTITKEELLEAVWQGVSVTDNALAQCITELRRVLRDDPKSPTFIKTLPKVGYRFLVPFDVIYAEPATPPVLEMPPASLEAPKSTSFRHTGWTLGVAAAVLIAVVSITSSVILHRTSNGKASTTTPPSFQKKMVIRPFENATGNPKMDWVKDGLPGMLSEDFRSGLHLSASVDTHSGSNDLYILGTVITEADHYLLRTEVHAADGKLLSSNQIPASTDGFPLAASLATSLMAGDLGIPSTDGDTQGEQEATTTRSAEAAHYYQQGVVRAKNFDTRHAIELLQKAIALDPKFAMAYARIGYTYAVVDFAPEKGVPYLQKASSLSANLSEQQRLYIAAWKATAEGKYAEATTLYSSLTQRFPKDTEAYIQLAKLQRSREQIDDAIATLQRGLNFSPNVSAIYNVLSVMQLAAHQYAAAVETAQQNLQLVPKEANAHDTMGMVYQQTGKVYQAMAEYSAALSLDPEFEPALVHMGDADFLIGLNEDAIVQYHRYIQAAHTDEARAVGYGNIATVYRRMGDLDRATEAAALEQHYNPKAIWNTLVIAVEKNDRQQAVALEAKLGNFPYTQERGAPGDLRTLAFERGWLALHHGNNDEAISYFSEALRHLPASSGIDLHESCLGDAFAQLGMRTEAVKEYQRVLTQNPNDAEAKHGFLAVKSM